MVRDVLGTVGVARTQPAVLCIVGVGDEHTLGVGGGEHVAGGIEGACGDAGVGAGLSRGIGQTVVLIGGGETTGVGHLGEVIQRVVGVLRRGVGRLRPCGHDAERENEGNTDE